MAVPASIFKAYDVRGLYPSEIDETAARLIGRAFVAYLDAARIGVSHDMRLSSPALSAAFIDGACEQGADIVDYGLAATDMLYFGVVRDGLDGGAQITASHNPKAYNGLKLVRRDALPLSGDAGIGDIHRMIAENAIPAPRRPRGLRRLLHAGDHELLDYADLEPAHRPDILLYRQRLQSCGGRESLPKPGFHQRRTVRIRCPGSLAPHQLHAAVELHNSEKAAGRHVFRYRLRWIQRHESDGHV